MEREFTGEYYICSFCGHIFDYMDICPICGENDTNTISVGEIKELIDTLIALLESHSDY